MKNYKELEIILASFECDKHCPYCTAKTTKWPLVDMNLDIFADKVKRLKNEGYTFHYVTIGGNGEPSLNPYNVLKGIVGLFDDYDIQIKRLLTSGNVFREEFNYLRNMFIERDWSFEVTAAYSNIEKDMKTLGYNHKYYLSNRFKEAKIMLNYVILKDNFNNMINEIDYWVKTYPNIHTISCKLLNVNTRENGTNNPFSKWIIENGFPKNDREMIKEKLDKTYDFLGYEFDSLNWKHPLGTNIHFSWKKGKYGMHDLVWYGDKFVDYSLNEVNVFEGE